ncbi:hypothetical protein CDAR_44561 [Caerostris darwini]|uniref:Uncharacterized protein n=1 Tax=Caerostris darwini TaxID=1538125 RepID=A0AAV4QRY7_9ARAC|nr:hypothetical protein CDAR_44561 [Caerostris darwini]
MMGVCHPGPIAFHIMMMADDHGFCSCVFEHIVKHNAILFLAKVHGQFFLRNGDCTTRSNYPFTSFLISICNTIRRLGITRQPVCPTGLVALDMASTETRATSQMPYKNGKN